MVWTRVSSLKTLQWRGCSPHSTLYERYLLITVETFSSVTSCDGGAPTQPIYSFFLVTVWNPVQSFSVFICEKLNKPNHIHLSPTEIQSSQLIPFPVPQGGTSGELRGQWHDVIRGKKKKNIQFFLLLKDSGFNLFPCHLIIIKNFNMEICSFCIFKEMPFLNTRQQIRQTHLTPAYALTLKTNK